MEVVFGQLEVLHAKVHDRSNLGDYVAQTHKYTITHTDRQCKLLCGSFKKHCCLLRRFNHNYYASKHQIAEDYFPIFVRRFIQLTKVIVRRPKLSMNKMSPFKKVQHKMLYKPGIEPGTLGRESIVLSIELSEAHWIGRQLLVVSYQFICYLLPINSN